MRVMLALLVATVCAVGCRMPEGSLSADGSHAAISTGKGLSIQGPTGSWKVTSHDTASPVWSPTGDRMAYFDRERNAALILNASSRALTQISPPLRAPLAWSPDGSELYGVQGRNLVVYHPKSRQIVRRYSIPKEPEALAVGPGRSAAIVSGSEFRVLRQGRWTRFSAEGYVSGLQFQPDGSLVWLAGNNKKMALTRLRLCRWRGGEPELLADESFLTRALHGQGRETLALGAKVSPDGQRIAVFGLVDASAPGLAAEYLHLAAKPERTAADRERISEIEPELRFRLTLGEVDRAGQFLSRRTGPETTADEAQVPTDLAWSGDGKRIGLVFDDHVQVLQPHQRDL